ncbi:hypothetical protein EW145_g1046 [Phellinidium pouzarii]|uniref:Monopolin complex subunit Csm1/Pcs1 C-terminal domain-containing protein n=1 Tax=Phellinidium pouzarii TaxID=167371 RepID=A0A4S4LFZ1_9AGAM|nr:hypothetical protein EW145_g1046 [Phellinidium pouzarii]
MSSDEDELGTYDTNTTPYRVEKFTDAMLKPTKPNGRVAVAGPSSKHAETRRGVRNRSPLLVEDGDETERVHESDGSGLEVVEIPKDPPKKGRPPRRAASREPENSAASSKSKNVQRGKGKGKGKAKPDVVREASPEVMDVDNFREEVENEPQDIPQPSLPQLKLKQRRVSGEDLVSRKREERDRKKIERLQKQLQDLKVQRDSLAVQLEEVFHTRNTELEERLESLTFVYESRIRTQEESIKEMTSQLARIDSLTREGKTSTLHFLTREAADEERRDIERLVDQLQEALKKKDKIIAGRDATINERDVEIRTLRIELSAEVDRSKSLAASLSNTRDPSSKVRMFASSTPGVKIDATKTSNIHRMYEDMSNILFIDCKYEPSSNSDDEQWVYSCLYTHLRSAQSLSFSLRTYTEPGDDGKAVEKVAYTPLQMSDNTPETIEKLDFLAGEFTFHRKQLDVFLNKMYNSMDDAFGTSEP